MVTIATFLMQWQAHMARGVLEAEDIPCVLLDENTAQNTFHAIAIGGIRLQVPEAYAQRAREILREAGVELTEE